MCNCSKSDTCQGSDKQNDGVFVCANTIKTLAVTGTSGTEISYSLELQDGTLGTFTIDNGIDIINVELTNVPNDATPINFILKTSGFNLFP